jgi:hypothetical protein
MKKVLIALSIGLNIALYACNDPTHKFGEESAREQNSTTGTPGTTSPPGYGTVKRHGPSITHRTDSSDEGMVHGSGSVPADKEK